MKTLLALFATVATVANAAVPLRWTVETSRVQPVLFEAYHGEGLSLEATFKSYGKPLAMAANPTLYWQTNGMGSAWWTAPAAGSSNVVTAAWLPSYDPGAGAVTGFIGWPGSNYRAAFSLRFRSSPGASPNTLPLPTNILDFAAIEVRNAPYYTKGATDARIIELAPTPGNYATVSNRAMTALQSYTETDPTVPSWAKSETAPTPGNYATVSNRAMTALQSYTETDPTVPSWAKSETAPTPGNYETVSNRAMTAEADATAKALSAQTTAILTAQNYTLTNALCVNKPNTLGSRFSINDSIGYVFKPIESASRWEFCGKAGFTEYAELLRCGNDVSIAASSSGDDANWLIMDVSHPTFEPIASTNDIVRYSYSKGETDARIIELAPTPGNYETVSNRAMTALQSNDIQHLPTGEVVTNIINGMADYAVQTAVTNEVASAMNDLLGENWRTTYGGGLVGILAAILAAIAVLKRRVAEVTTTVGTANGDLEDALGTEAE